MTFKVIPHFIKSCVFILLTLLKVLKRLDVKTKNIWQNTIIDDFEILRLPFVTFNDFSGHTSFNKKNCVFILLVFIETLSKSVNRRMC